MQSTGSGVFVHCLVEPGCETHPPLPLPSSLKELMMSSSHGPPPTARQWAVPTRPCGLKTCMRPRATRRPHCPKMTRTLRSLETPTCGTKWVPGGGRQMWGGPWGPGLGEGLLPITSLLAQGSSCLSCGILPVGQCLGKCPGCPYFSLQCLWS